MRVLSGVKTLTQILQTIRSSEQSLFRLGGFIQHANFSSRRRHDDFVEEPKPIPYSGNFPRIDHRRIEDRDFEQIELERNAIISKVNAEVKNQAQNRLFAVIHVAGKQFKITPEDVIIVQGYWAPDVGDRVRLEKVLLAGGPSFTLLGRPLLPKDLVKVEGTVIEKTLSYTQLHFVLKKRQNYRRLKFDKIALSMVRINSIDVVGQVDEFKEVEGLRPNAVV